AGDRGAFTGPDRVKNQRQRCAQDDQYPEACAYQSAACSPEFGRPSRWRCGARCRDVRRIQLISPGNFGDKSIPAPSDRRNVAILAARLPQHLPQGGDVLRETVFLDDYSRPYRVQQNVLIQRLASAFDETEQRVEYPAGERNSLPGLSAQQALLADVQGEIAEFVERTGAGHEKRGLVRINQNFSLSGQGFFHG